MPKLSAQYLDPGSYLGEALFGLIMTLTFTLAADLVIGEQGSDGTRQMLIAIFGCNLAWGIIDGVLYVLGRAFERGRLARIRYEILASPSPLRARQFVAAELDEMLSPLTNAQQRDSLYAAIVQHVTTGVTEPQPVARKDLLGGLESGLLVLSCSFPAVLPFLLFHEPKFALRVSNTILLGLLYYLGYRHARHTLARPWIAGLVFLLAGVLLVAVAILLGG